MEDILKLLYLLQKVDSELEELEDLKGDLPVAVNQLREKTSILQVQIDAKSESIIQLKTSRDKADSDSVDFKAKIEKYKEQQYHVRNNREYDAITKELDFANSKIAESEIIFLESEDKISAFQNEIEELNKELASLLEELKVNEEELNIITKENLDEMNVLQNEKSKILVRVDPEFVNHYERIHSGRRGKAIVAVRKDCCSGCNNRIPPQHLIELKRNDKIYYCQHCGRIVVSENVANDASKVMQS